MTNDQTIENEIQAKGKTAPRVTPADIEANILHEIYLNAGECAVAFAPEFPNYKPLPDSASSLNLLTFCVLVLRNGHTVSGESHCQDPAKFNAQIGRDEARKDAINKLWPMVVYAARSETTEQSVHGGKVLTEADALADLRGEPRPDWSAA